MLFFYLKLLEKILNFAKISFTYETPNCMSIILQTFLFYIYSDIDGCVSNKILLCISVCE